MNEEIKVNKARCEKVQAIINNKLDTFKLLREEIYPPMGDFADGPMEVAVVECLDEELVKIGATEIMVPIDCVVFINE